MEKQNNKKARLLLIDGKADLRTPETKEKMDAAEVVFVGLKLVKNTGNEVYDRVGTLIARSEIAKVQRKFHRTEVEEISA